MGSATTSQMSRAQSTALLLLLSCNSCISTSMEDIYRKSPLGKGREFGGSLWLKQTAFIGIYTNLNMGLRGPLHVGKKPSIQWGYKTPRAVALAGKRRESGRRSDLWKEKAISEIVADWPLGLGWRSSKSQREREDERTWEWFSLLIFRIKVRKALVVYFKAFKLILLYVAFSMVFSATHVFVLMTAMLASFQILLEWENDKGRDEEEKLLADLLPDWDEDLDP